MKSWNRFFTVFLTVALLAGCSDDRYGENDASKNPYDSESALYTCVDVVLPMAGKSRSETNNDGSSSGGSEIGQDQENKVNTLLLLLADQTNGYIAHSIIGGLTTSVSGGKPIVSATASISGTDLNAYYEKVGNRVDKKIRVYAFCNPTQELIDEIKNNKEVWFDAVCTVLQVPNTSTATSENTKNTTVWGANSFLMSNVAVAERKIPDSFDEWVRYYAKETTPFNLSGKNDATVDNDDTGAIAVERSVARFDFRDGSQSGKPHTYNIGTTGGVQDGSLQVRLVRMGLLNMSKRFYFLRRVSDDGSATGAQICGAETPINYVVDPDSEFKRTVDLEDGGVTDVKEYFNFCLFNAQGTIDGAVRKGWDNYDISSVTSGTPLDNANWTGGPADKKEGYYIWRYVTENAIPGAEKQKNGISTGIVFKGKLIIPDGSHVNQTLKDAVAGNYDVPNTYTKTIGDKKYPILYVFQDKLYVGWNDQVREAIDNGAGSPIAIAATAMATDAEGKELGIPDDLYKEVLTKTGSAQETALLKFKKAAVAAGFTLYEASDDADEVTADKTNYGVGYFFYYYYWNRHNDNGMPGAMGPMEFGVVRNNVYKLAVTNIRRLGHPRLSENDPEPPTPGTDDEDGDVYLTLSVEVLPWVVRVNNIEF